MKICTERNSRAVRVVFLALSGAGWLVFLIGFGKMLTSLKEYKDNDDPAKAQPPDNLVKTFTSPFWLYLVSGVLLYITYVLQVFKFSENTGHILHCLIVFFNFFFTSGGILTINIGMMFEIKSTHFLLVAVLPDKTAMTMIIGGTVSSLVLFWIGLGVWPLFKIRRQRHNGYTELQESQ